MVKEEVSKRVQADKDLQNLAGVYYRTDENKSQEAPVKTDMDNLADVYYSNK